jgi:hypothetical protein
VSFHSEQKGPGSKTSESHMDYFRHMWQNLVSRKLFKNFPIFYGARRLITVFTRSLQWYLSWARSIQSMPPRSCLFKIHLNIISPPKFTSSGFPTKIFYMYSFRPPCVLHALPISFSLIDSSNFIWRAIAWLVEALCYKPEGRGFDSRWGHWAFQLT